MTLYWIELEAPGRLAIMARPRAGDWLEDEIAMWKREGVDVAVSLLEQHEVADLELQDEADACRRVGIEFLAFPIEDRGVPASITAARNLVTDLSARVRSGMRVAIHCRAGIGRSSLMAAFLMAHLDGTQGSEQVLQTIGKARGLQVPDTDAQREWLAVNWL
ncbi:protein-tyrosine phosphatase family protein [Brevundimonas sp.]|uniref:phosphatase domain-containing putative toxin n=1 Tax=Brevundimonas sp. TaxID=1871086 RepID=UPI0027300154|nr:protein-tyrosine phosphatase family protein [Brevundimonas sp.]MDP1913015.1 protein-tyrosine phosphatase family protein [Brevundimonas sp.]